jgi:hypothetical protein
MARLATIATGVGVALAFGLGGIGGYVYARLAQQSSTEHSSSRDTAFLHKLEEIEANLKCDDLKNVGLKRPRSAGDITVYVDVRDDYYYVIGLASGAPGAPLISWTGADRKEMLRQICN